MTRIIYVGGAYMPSIWLLSSDSRSYRVPPYLKEDIARYVYVAGSALVIKPTDTILTVVPSFDSVTSELVD